MDWSIQVPFSLKYQYYKLYFVFWLMGGSLSISLIGKAGGSLFMKVSLNFMTWGLGEGIHIFWFIHFSRISFITLHSNIADRKLHFFRMNSEMTTRQNLVVIFGYLKFFLLMQLLWQPWLQYANLLEGYCQILFCIIFYSLFIFLYAFIMHYSVKKCFISIMNIMWSSFLVKQLVFNCEESFGTYNLSE